MPEDLTLQWYSRDLILLLKRPSLLKLNPSVIEISLVVLQWRQIGFSSIAL